MAPTKGMLTKAIDRLEREAINPRISQIQIKFVAHASYSCSLVVLGILVNLNPNWATLIGSLGLGALGFGANFKRAEEAMDQFFKDTRALRVVVTDLRVSLELCKKSDTKALQGIEMTLKSVVHELKAG